MTSILGLLPLVIFLVVALGASWLVRSRQNSGGFVENYFIGNRALGGFVLAMTTVATYGSVSSFVGGPGQAWEIGFGWVYMATVQVTAMFLLFGILGKKMALISRRIGAVTVIDVIGSRYESKGLTVAGSIVIVLFFAATMVAQFVGGAKLFSAITGYSYVMGLAIFGIAVIAFTTIGGFRGVAVTDALCGIAMLVGIVILAVGILDAGGGFAGIMDTIRATDATMLEPLSGGDMPLGLYFTQWLLVGVLTFALPQSMVRTLGFKNMKAMRTALIMGTVVIGAMMIGMTALGVLSKGVLTGTLTDYGNSVDNIIPLTVVAVLPRQIAAIAIIGPLAASISTVSSLLISSSSAIVKDLYLNWRAERGKPVAERGVANLSRVVTLAVGAIVFVLSVVPPDVIWKINMFAFGGLETAFCWVMVCGLFWKRANKTGALLSMVGGTLAYCICMGAGFSIGGLHQIVIGITVSFACMVAGSLAGKPASAKAMEVFFPSLDETEPADAGKAEGEALDAKA